MKKKKRKFKKTTHFDWWLKNRDARGVCDSSQKTVTRTLFNLCMVAINTRDKVQYDKLIDCMDGGGAITREVLKDIIAGVVCSMIEMKEEGLENARKLD